MQRRVTGRRLRVDIRAGRHERLDGIQLAGESRHIQRGRVISRTLLIHFRAGRKQLLQLGDVPA